MSKDTSILSQLQGVPHTASLPLQVHTRSVHVIPYSVHSRERLKETEGTDLVRCSPRHHHYQLSFSGADHHLNYLVSSLPDRFLQTITLLSMSME